MALQEKRIPLEIDLAKVTIVDDSARAYLERLRVRGARIVQGNLVGRQFGQRPPRS